MVPTSPAFEPIYPGDLQVGQRCLIAPPKNGIYVVQSVQADPYKAPPGRKVVRVILQPEKPFHVGSEATALDDHTETGTLQFEPWADVPLVDLLWFIQAGP